MSKIKKLWKVLAGSISWNLRAPKINDQSTKPAKKERRKDPSQGDMKEGFAG